jgi:hypothetical protein
MPAFSRQIDADFQFPYCSDCARFQPSKTTADYCPAVTLAGWRAVTAIRSGRSKKLVTSATLAFWQDSHRERFISPC